MTTEKKATTKAKETVKKETKKVEKATKKETVAKKADKEEIKEIEKDKEELKMPKMDELIKCKSVFHGGLTYKSNRTNAIIRWSEFGTFQYLEFRELLDMANSCPVFLEKPYLVVEDERAIIHLGLDELYENLMCVNDIDNFFNLSINEIRERIQKAPHGLKQLIASKAREKVQNQTLYDIRIIKILEEELNIQLDLLK